MPESGLDVTERFVFSRLKDSGFAVELVLASMTSLPSALPPHFSNTFTPIAAAGTDGQVRHVTVGNFPGPRPGGPGTGGPGPLPRGPVPRAIRIAIWD